MKPGASISESAFQNKTRRGRPVKFPEMKALEKLKFPPNVTPRQKQNYMYAIQAGSVLDPKLFPHLFTRRPNYTILGELGRILPDRTFMLGVAERICKEKLRTNQAVTLIRQLRGKSKPTDRFKLWQAIQRTIEKHRSRYPGQLSNIDVRAVLSTGETFYLFTP